MDIAIQPKGIHELVPTDIVFQTAYWGQVKSRLGWKPVAFDFNASTGQRGDVMILLKTLAHDCAVACVPQGPERGPDPERYGIFLEALSRELVKHLDATVAFIRYDLPWESAYALDAEDEETWCGYPDALLRALRMNIGTRTWPFYKTPMDLTVADAVVIDLARSEEDIFKAMKPKTRYNIRLARRKGVSVFKSPGENLPLFYQLYVQTARRNNFPPSSYRHFNALFSEVAHNPGAPEILLLLAARERDILAGAIIAISGRRATYLYGASADEGRNLMGSYAMHWEAIRLAKRTGCLTYDMGSVSPVADPIHPFYGMYRFKTGFGGKITHRNGTWDYPIHKNRYSAFSNYEAIGMKLPRW
jgi:lipid II:glycine glycyltransferase (peptidoglycan interpeptide bridge formation enzyme)